MQRCALGFPWRLPLAAFRGVSLCCGVGAAKLGRWGREMDSSEGGRGGKGNEEGSVNGVGG